MITITKHFENITDTTGDFSWKHSMTAQDLLMTASFKERSKISGYFQNFFWDRLEPDSSDAIVSGNSSSSYIVGVDFDKSEMGCECKAFKYRDGACKHIYALLSKSLSKLEKNFDLTPENWLKRVVFLSRNTEDNREYWMEPIQWGDNYVRVRRGAFSVKGVVVDGKLWSNSSLPSIGDKVKFYDENSMVREGVIKSVYDKPEKYLGFWVDYENDENENSSKVIFGVDLKSILSEV